MMPKNKFIIILSVIIIIGSILGSITYIIGSNKNYPSIFDNQYTEGNISSAQIDINADKQERIRQQELRALAGFIAGAEVTTIASGDYIIYRQDNALYRYGLRNQRVTKIVTLPPIDEDQIPDPLLIPNVFAGKMLTTRSGIYIDGQLYGFPKQAIRIELNGETSIVSSSPCFAPQGGGVTFACSSNGIWRVELEDVNEYFNDRPWRTAFKIRRYELDGAPAIEKTITNEEIVKLNNVKPLLIADDGQDVYIAAFGDEGGYYRLWRFNMDTAEVFTYHFGETAEMGLDKFRGTPRYYSGYVLSPATKQALLDNQQSRYGDNECRKLNSNADIYLLDLEKDNKRRIGQDKDFIYGMSISPDGKWYTFSRADMPPGCRERETAKEDLNIQHWVVPLPFNRMHPRAKQLSGSFVAWLDTDFLLLLNC
ncbi:MAG: hypothetical protein UX17_C0044G0002 [Parcubacteria group bacterium GW2011_GWC2_45_7]|nr:MAG: hypothetical protein UX17_C0044G0002 [Parcubacteria group bacterium GW2011_GWC2_45_7]